jgi:predicted nucleic acid-binding protein
MVLVDTNVLIDVVQPGQPWAEWSIKQLELQSKVHRLVINPIVFAELSLSYETFDQVEAAVTELRLPVLELPRPALFLAGRAFLRYKRAGGTKSSVLADFFIGAHAAVAGAALLTREPRRYEKHFPSVPLITPVQ